MPTKKYLPVFNLNIRIPSLLTTFILKEELVHSTTLSYVLTLVLLNKLISHAYF